MSAAILIAEDDPGLRMVLGRALTGRGYRVHEAADGELALERLREGGIDLALLDIRMPRRSGLEVLEALAGQPDLPPCIVLTAENTPDNAIRAMKAGAWEYLTKPVDLDELDALVERALAERPPAEETPPAHLLDGEENRLIGRSRSMQEVFKIIGRVAGSRVSVLLLGPSGSGKELVARTIHAHSERSAGPFVALNTAALPPSLLESELFGHVRGAFTGADQDRPGAFKLADGGTLFLDEIGEMPPPLQASLLRALQEQTFYPVGGSRPVRVDVRIISATHRDLARQIAAGEFRADLFHRLNVVPLTLPSLGERRDDIPELARHFLGAACRELGVEAKTLSAEALLHLQTRDWPGNVRELKNAITRAVALASGPVLLPRDFGGPPRLAQESFEQLVARRLKEVVRTYEVAGDRGDLHEVVVAATERALFRLVLRRTRGNQLRASELLGIHRNTLRARLRQLDLDAMDFRGASATDDEL